MTKRKVSLKLIENDNLRKSCFRKRQAGLLKKVEELTTLCDIDACAIIRGLGDENLVVWPSPIVANHLLLRFQNAPELDRFRKRVNQRVYMREKTKRIQDQVVKLKQRNEEKDMSIFMHHIYHDGKSLSDFEVSDLRHLLCYVEEKLKAARKKISYFEKLAPNPPPPSPPQISCPLENGDQDDINYWINMAEQVSQQQWFLDLLKEADKMDSGFGNSTGSNKGLPPHTDLGDTDMVLPQGNFRGLGDESDSGVLPQGNFNGLNGESDHSGLLPQGNFRGLNVESDSGVLPQGNFIGFDGESDSGVLPHGNFKGLNGESYSGVFPPGQGNFRGLNDESNSGLLYGSSIGEIEGSDIWLPYGHFGSTIGGSDMRLPCTSSKGNINGSYMGIGQHNENHGGPINNVGLWFHGSNFGANNSGAAMGRFDANFVGTNNGGNLNTGLPTHGNFASSCEGSDIGVPTSFEGNFPGSDWGPAWV